MRTVSNIEQQLERLSAGCLSEPHLLSWVSGACWERNPNYRLPLADKRQRCLRCSVKHRKMEEDETTLALLPSKSGSTRSQRAHTEMLDCLDTLKRYPGAGNKDPLIVL